MSSIRITRFRVLQSTISKEATSDVPAQSSGDGEINYTLTPSFAFIPEESRMGVIVEFHIWARTDDDPVTFARIECLSDFVVDSADPARDETLLAIGLGICLSTTRGALHVLAGDTILAKNPIPVMSPRDIVATLMKSEEWQAQIPPAPEDEMAE
jgi:hypothetical protein